jgi:predicted ribosomally synthesized peptide with nif11-like leader
MSLEQAKALIDKLNKDEIFRDTIFAIEKIDDRIRAINEAGFSCTIEEIQQVN